MAEVKAACDAHVQELANRRRYENWGKQLAAPDQGDAKAITVTRPTREELEKKYGINFGLDREPWKMEPAKCTMTSEELAEYYKNFGLGRQKKQDP
ncbi:MAG: hypothetical protein WAV72_05300 [Bradyrhizobium sp.]